MCTAFIYKGADVIFGFNMVTFILTQLVFRKRRYNTFEEEEAAEVAEVTEAK